MPTMERVLVCKPDAVASSLATAIQSKSESNTSDDEDSDSDDEIGRMIYNSSRTAKARAAAEA